ncbi:cation efflux family-domain-containing protein [Obelidium mucronatum]|nr:cation efflux family-domain-containing protein [Obelidium mucronatum]
MAPSTTSWHKPTSLSPLLKAGLICFAFFLVEICAAFWTGSLAILSDAVHMSTDLLGYAIAIAAAEIGTWPATKHYTFGFARVELIGALMSLLLTWNLIYHLIEEAFHRIQSPQQSQEINAPAMALGALFSCFANAVMALALTSSESPNTSELQQEENKSVVDNSKNDESSSLLLSMKSRQEIDNDDTRPAASHSQDSISRRRTESSSNLNVQAAMIHIVGDLLGSISILIAALVLMYQPTWTILDPLCTILFSVIIFMSSLGLLKRYMMVLMESVPDGVDVDVLKEGIVEEFRTGSGGWFSDNNVVVGVEVCKVWMLTEGKECCVLVVTVSLAADETVESLSKVETMDIVSTDSVVEDEEETVYDVKGESTTAQNLVLNHSAFVERIKSNVRRRFELGEIYVEIKQV